MSEDQKITVGEALASLPKEVMNEPVGPMVAISAMALTMSLKYHDINTVKDGALYQQYKLEGKNFRDLHLDMVFETAIRIEKHLVAANKRVSKFIVAAALAEDVLPEDGIPETAAPQGEE